MKDPKDTRTVDFVSEKRRRGRPPKGSQAMSGAERQAAYRQRQESEGKIQRTVMIDRASWEAGYAAGLAGQSSRARPGIADRLAFLSGYIEGKAKREG